jgi:hypothetical protein
MHKENSSEDPRRFYDRRVSALRLQILDQAEPYSRIGIDIRSLANNGFLFRAGVISPEEVCMRAMKTFWVHESTLEFSESRYNLASLGHDFGMRMDISAEALDKLWDTAQDKY